jgi:CheY-like chemotaxis protein
MNAMRLEQPAVSHEDGACAPQLFRYPSPVILAVDDSPEVRGLLRHMLGRTYTVLLASNGLEAIERLEQVQIDLVITDITMPEMGGIELADHILRHYPHIRLAFVSSCLDEETRTAIARRSRYSLAKPFSIHALRGVLSELLA